MFLYHQHHHPRAYEVIKVSMGRTAWKVLIEPVFIIRLHIPQAWDDSNNTMDGCILTCSILLRKALHTAIQHIIPEEDIRKQSKF
jgi:hypothetical protein